ncbi:MAG TPA: TonB-dependent receptor [Gammaproteobacteria bacterium]|nr:TonB-dependent receptor [Gammaproteobacteria bacterium]
MELVAQKELISESGVGYSLSLTYTSTEATFENTFSSSFWGNVTSGMDIPDLPDSQLALRGGFLTITGWKGDATVYSYGSTCSIASCSSGTKIDSYTVLDLSLSKSISDKLDLYTVIENITDERDVVARAPKNGARAQKPRTVLVGLRWKI